MEKVVYWLHAVPPTPVFEIVVQSVQGQCGLLINMSPEFLKQGMGCHGTPTRRAFYCLGYVQVVERFVQEVGAEGIFVGRLAQSGPGPTSRMRLPTRSVYWPTSCVRLPTRPVSGPISRARRPVDDPQENTQDRFPARSIPQDFLLNRCPCQTSHNLPQKPQNLLLHQSYTRNI